MKKAAAKKGGKNNATTNGRPKRSSKKRAPHTKQERLILEVSEQIAALTPAVKRAKADWEDAKVETARLKKDWEGAANNLTNLCQQLVDIENGNYQPTLPFKPPEAATTAPAAAKRSDSWGKEPIAVLAKHGLTGKQCEFLAAAKLDTVRDLRDFVNRDDQWHRMIKGIGPKKIDSVIDALNAYYAANPEPEPEPAKTEGDAKTEEAPATESKPAEPGTAEQNAPAAEAK